MNLVTFHLRLQVQKAYKGICECNRIIYNTDIKSIIKTMKNKRRNQAKFLMELEESINILSLPKLEASRVRENEQAKEVCSRCSGTKFHPGYPYQKVPCPDCSGQTG